MDSIIAILAREFNQRADYVENVVHLLDEGNTVPFIARYRKELHGTMDDQLIREIADRVKYLRNLAERREEIRSAIAAQEKLTEELSAALDEAATLAALEDLYRPYKPKRRTRASMAKEKGLGPLAELLYAQELREGELTALAAEYINEELGVESAEAALQGASDIIAEAISDDAAIRGDLKQLYRSRGEAGSSALTEEDSVYKQYYDFHEPLHRLQSHQILALNRGEKEKFLKVELNVEDRDALSSIKRRIIRPLSISAPFVATAAEDAWGRLLQPSMERELRSDLTEKASEQAIHTFALNLRPLLMQPPLKGRVVMGFDPAYRTGCKIAVVDETGKVLETGVVYPTVPHNKTREAKVVLSAMIRRHGVSAIAIGNGTASRESEIFVADMLKDHPGVSYMVVSEAGASVYSASKLGAAEFPDFDVSLRSAVSIARRLQDPLAELVKIDPKSIGVGQYQHDMPPARLDETLRGVVEDCVNSVGVDLNTASPSLLEYVAGLNATTAKNIVAYREENGLFKSRKELKKVPKIGPKAFEQCAGFLRIPGGKEFLDNTGVHPESYAATEKLLAACGCSLSNTAELRERVKRLSDAELAACGIGRPTALDIAAELMKPGRDPRDELPAPLLRTDVLGIEDLKPGMTITGTVRNVVDFGAFVDIGVHQDGLVHISQLSERRVKHPSEVVKVSDVVDCVVLDVDVKKKRISLSMKAAKKAARQG